MNDDVQDETLINVPRNNETGAPVSLSGSTVSCSSPEGIASESLVEVLACDTSSEKDYKDGSSVSKNNPAEEPSDAPPNMGAFSPTFHQRRKKGKFREVEPPQISAEIADTHAHLGMVQNPSLRLARCAYHHVSFVCAMNDPSDDSDTTYSALDVWLQTAHELLCAQGYDYAAAHLPCVRIATGIHPHSAKKYDDQLEERLIARLRDPRTCALGEVGLDYHYDFSPREVQRTVFRRQIRIAKEAGLPLILHIREAHDDAYAILHDEGFPQAGTLLHCFNLGPEVLEPWLEHNCYIAYGGPITFKKADEVRQSSLLVDREHLLSETDSPFMTPEPMRGMECGPEHVVFNATRLAETRNFSSEEETTAFLSQMYSNAISLLNRKPTSWQEGRDSCLIKGAHE